MTYLHELSPKIRFYSFKITVIIKNRAIKPVGKNRYQRLILKDQKGTTMDATIYGDDIDMFNDVIIKNGEYEISNAYISRVNTNFPGHSADYQMTISGRTLLCRLDSGASSSQEATVYRQLISIPYNPYTSEQFDLLAIVLYVGHAKPITGLSGFPVNVSELVVTDDITDNTLIVSLWNDLSDNEAMKLSTIVDDNPIVSFTDLHASKFYGFDPIGERVEALKKWKTSQASLIKERMKRATKACTMKPTPKSCTIKEMLSITHSTVVYGTNIRLNIFIPDFKPDNITLFCGCQHCGKKCDQERNATFECEICNQLSVAEPRLFFNFHGTDGSGTKLFSMYTKVAEKLLGIDVNALSELSPEEKVSFYDKLSAKFRAKATCIELSPTPPPAAGMQIIKWIVKDMVPE